MSKISDNVISIAEVTIYNIKIISYVENKSNNLLLLLFMFVWW